MDSGAIEAATTESVRAALKTVDDPEAGMDIVELGLVYEIVVEGDRVQVRMTMTSAACPVGDLLVDSARDAILGAHPRVRQAEVRLVWEPEWSPEMMSPAAREFFGWS